MKAFALTTRAQDDSRSTRRSVAKGIDSLHVDESKRQIVGEGIGNDDIGAIGFWSTESFLGKSHFLLVILPEVAGAQPDKLAVGIYMSRHERLHTDDLCDLIQILAEIIL